MAKSVLTVTAVQGQKGYEVTRLWVTSLKVSQKLSFS